MKTIALIEKGTDGTYGVFAPNLQSTIIGEGASVAEAKADFLNTYEEIKIAFAEAGEDMPSELKDLEFEFQYDVASIFNYFDFINVSKFAKRVGINASLMRQYKSCGTAISEAQAKRIQTALREVGNELLAVSL